MATATDYCCHDHEYLKSWSFPELLSEGQNVPISEILDHGSISFGRYATESLAWEKWSVFSHNRCQEELEKFKAPGLVAQKKAYFEEYYKKVRAMKALQAQQQETAQPDCCQDAQSNIREVENDVISNLTASQVEKKPSNVSQVPMSDNDMISNLNSSLADTEDELEQAAEKQESYPNGCNDKATMKNKMKFSFPTSVQKDSTLLTSSGHSSKSTKKNISVSNTVSNNANQLIKKHASFLQAKGTVASIRNKTKSDSSRSSTNNVKLSAKPKTTLHRKSIPTNDKGCPTSKISDPKAANNNNRKITDVRSSATVIKSSLARDTLVSPLLSAIRTRQLTTNTTSKGLVEKIPTRSLVHAQSAKLVSSSSSIRACQVNKSSTSQGLVEKLPTRLSVHSRPAQSISEKITVAGSLINTALSKRSVDISMQEKSNQKIGVEFEQSSYVKEGKQKEEKDKLTAALGREPKVVLSARVEKDSNAALGREPKVLSTARAKKDSNVALGREPKGSLYARVKKDSNATLAREPKAVLSARLRKDSNAALGREPATAPSAGLGTDTKCASSALSNVPLARNAKLTQKVVPCRSPDLMHDRKESTQPRPRPTWR
ncbi:hypothetical protein Ddye_005204 [Dipteronia dyeriana]|uniref:TPX2 C-terminal domain-containing protein n=1 Tax=Dipteronia dyeriana TaxID=168575 RepID=A0AAD9TD44_9ROSI|nr:hypothetical protein Ddye_032462 [Dipteronia dyeriana]KAK2658671.1 hypothetical protein Ddye_005204 [Dipteronia dyeriana]